MQTEQKINPESSWVEKAELAALNQEIDDKREIEEREVLVVFPLGKEKYAISIEKVKEVVKLPPIAPIPQSADYILGVGNIRGNVIAITDLAKRLNLDYKSDIDLDASFVIVLKDSLVHAGMVVAQVPDTIVVNKSQINTSAAVIKNLSATDQFIKGIVKVDGDMIILIDILEMIEN
ncbi:MAG: hypothetical protein CMB80_19595 [Flammeovirgaceae bacterium]|nr:hypothetical protein [Flammeovirgaceae bacterium]HCX21963.1 hypothetical protein [Cytophagales bacterium]